MQGNGEGRNRKGLSAKFLVGLIFSFALILVAELVVRGLEPAPAHVPYYNTPDYTPSWLTLKSDVEKQITHKIADFSFHDQTGSIVTRASVTGKIHIADFFFTTCAGVCPTMSHSFKLLQDSLLTDRNVLLLSFSVTPDIDSVARLKEYAENYGAVPTKWLLMTGSKNEIYTLARKSYFADGAIGYSKDSSQFLHTEQFVLVDRSERIRGFYNGTMALDRQRLLTDIRTLERE